MAETPVGGGVHDAVHVVGVGADGWAGLPERLRALVSAAEVVVGGERHLAMLPGDVGAERLAWPSPLRAALPGLVDAWVGRRVVVLASGDPYVAGIGTTLQDFLPAERLVVHPAVSSVALARARMGWAAETVTVLRHAGELPRHVTPGNRILLLSMDDSAPLVARDLLPVESLVTALIELGGPDERRISATAGEWREPLPELHVLAIEVRGERGHGWTAGVDEDEFAHDGQISKRDVRASALARLAPAPGELLWDVGAGSGAVGIEWMRAHPRCRTIAVEADPERVVRIVDNSTMFGVPALRVVEGRAPGALADLPAPDAVFVGGGATREGVLETVWERLRPRGRLVVHAVTLETERVLLDWAGRVGGELTRISVETARPIGTFTGWEPARAVVQWAVTKGELS
ncbi:precorrin-6Y C5,15-methyltransferase (decarboxylating) subunit CbiT [Aeromicrobium sp. Leaf350]|uniref:precorrin-6Y C5,15-methyltransferase (decarboxylating) subunit CbiT n=1 Tax=Aeromicrobium sp. Leaf350 TaxID=2876565 RepID=UPI001E5C031A|nr:precorrin-6Y C5,15-methyltransferase (decarboxylating) subunit CbiT [Aeromicrobium sp. Leaf350]